MKRIFDFLLIITILTIFVSCAKVPSGPVITAACKVDHISCRNAVISGKANLSSTPVKDLTFGILYSTSSGVLIGTATQIQARSFDSDYNFSVKTDVLEPETTYYYRSYIVQKDEVVYGEVKSFKTLPVGSMIQTLDATDINPKDATFNAMLNLTDCLYENCEYGFEVTPEGGQSYSVKSQNHADNKFSYKDETLAKDSKYSVSAYVKLDDKTYKGVPIEFTTTSIQASVTAESQDVGNDAAKVTGKLSVVSEGTFTKSVKVYYSNKANTIADLKSSGSVNTPTLAADGSYTAFLVELTWESTYYFVAVAKVDDKEFVSEVKSFTTTFPSLIGLSKNGTANCYIVTESGNYSFNAMKGNTFDSVGSVASAEVLWESFGTWTAPSKGDLVSNATYSDGYISFSASSLKGNAVIAAKDASGNILWSWHIWLTDKPEDQVYNNNAGTMMDRNLGATSATKGDVKALGLLYQWGRKDPFLGSSSISSSTKARSTITWPSKVPSNSSNGTIAYATAHPTTCITNNINNDDWYYTGSSSTDNTRWQTSDKAKGLYDPCPAGYRVPDGGSNGVWVKAFGTSSSWKTSSNWDSTGMNFGKTDKRLGSGNIWYSAAGLLWDDGGSLDGVGYGGFYWSCTPDSSHACYLIFIFDGGVNPSVSYGRAYGLSVRCLRE